MATLTALCPTVSHPAITGIIFLFGGQRKEDASAMDRDLLLCQALQASALKAWGGKEKGFKEQQCVTSICQRSGQEG